ncbi:LOW QUALITY PROTEIN: hypothetical protein ACHAWF_012748 [Thalassiosira exigua]
MASVGSEDCDKWCQAHFIHNTKRNLDRPEAGVMHNWKVGPPSNSTYILCYDQDKRRRVPIQSHEIVQDYIDHMHGIDCIDRSMADYNMSMKGNIFYRRIFYYIANAALANMRIITKTIVEQAMNQA